MEAVDELAVGHGEDEAGSSRSSLEVVEVPQGRAVVSSGHRESCGLQETGDSSGRELIVRLLGRRGRQMGCGLLG